MKATKILALIIALAMSLTLAACGDEATPSSNTPNNDPSANNQGTNAENPDNGAENPDNNDNNTPGNGTATPEEFLHLIPPWHRTPPVWETRPPLYLPESFKTHESDAEFFYALTNDYIAYSYEIIIRPSAGYTDSNGNWVQPAWDGYIDSNGNWVEQTPPPDEITTGYVVYFFWDGVGAEVWNYPDGESNGVAIFAKKAYPNADQAVNSFSADDSSSAYYLMDNIIYAKGPRAQFYDVAYYNMYGNTRDYYDYKSTTKAELLEKLTASLDDLQSHYKQIEYPVSEFSYEIYVSQQ
ncbi:MAG: hypothetical protein FWG70_03430 [Oscillospiraceae bacterium]|nr:hypothetical protein [Oscillospiraceae bacterium]